MFDLFKNWFGNRIDCTDLIQQQIDCSMDYDSIIDFHSSIPIGGCNLDLNGNGICDFNDPCSPFNTSGIFNDSFYTT